MNVYTGPRCHLRFTSSALRSPALHDSACNAPQERLCCPLPYSPDVAPEPHGRAFLARRFLGGDSCTSMPPAATSHGGTSRRAMAVVLVLLTGFFFPAITDKTRTHACRFLRTYFLRTLMGNTSWCEQCAKPHANKHAQHHENDSHMQSSKYMRT